MQESCGGSTKSTKIEMLKTVKGMKTGRVIPLLSQWGRWEHCHLSLAGPDGPQPPTAFWCILALKLQLFAPENRQQRYYIKRTDRQKMNIYISNQNCRIAAKNWEVIHQSTKNGRACMHACSMANLGWTWCMWRCSRSIACGCFQVLFPDLDIVSEQCINPLAVECSQLCVAIQQCTSQSLTASYLWSRDDEMAVVKTATLKTKPKSNYRHQNTTLF